MFPGIRGRKLDSPAKWNDIPGCFARRINRGGERIYEDSYDMESGHCADNNITAMKRGLHCIDMRN